MQPTHYEVFVANYSVLVATVLIAGILFSKLTSARKTLFSISLILVAAASLAWGMFEVARSTAKFTPASLTRDEATPAAMRLAALGENSASESLRTDQVILATDPVVADYLPTIAPQPLLWAPHMYGFAGVSPAEDKRRLLALLYYTGIHFDHVDEQGFKTLDAERKFYFSVLLGTSRSRADKSLSNVWKPIQPEEYEGAERAYSEFVASFNSQTASRPLLTLVLTASDRPVDFSNLDRWYERTEQERIGKFILYRVRLRP